MRRNWVALRKEDLGISFQHGFRHRTRPSQAIVFSIAHPNLAADLSPLSAPPKQEKTLQDVGQHPQSPLRAACRKLAAPYPTVRGDYLLLKRVQHDPTWGSATVPEGHSKRVTRAEKGKKLSQPDGSQSFGNSSSSLVSRSHL